MPTYVCFISAHQSQIDNVWDTKHWSAMLLSPGIHVPGSGPIDADRDFRHCFRPSRDFYFFVQVRSERLTILDTSGPGYLNFDRFIVPIFLV